MNKVLYKIRIKHSEFKGRAVEAGGAEGAMDKLDFFRSVNPFSAKGADYAHNITTCTPGFSDLRTALVYNK